MKKPSKSFEHKYYETEDSSVHHITDSSPADKLDKILWYDNGWVRLEYIDPVNNTSSSVFLKNMSKAEIYGENRYIKIWQSEEWKPEIATPYTTVESTDKLNYCIESNRFIAILKEE